MTSAEADASAASAGSLWRHGDFRRLWLGQTISKFGSHFTGGALPLLAVLTLQATPVQMGLLSAAGAAPILVVGLLAGVWVDRLRRRPILIVADLARAALLLSIPVAAMLGSVTMPQLYLVAALVGVLTVFFDVAYQSYLPGIVSREQIVEGNSKLGVSDSVAEIAGPPVGVALVQWIGAPLTILLDALSFLLSAAALGLIRKPEPVPARPDKRQSVLRDLAVGVRAVLGEPLLRALLGADVTLNLFGGIIGTIYFLYTLDELGMQPFAVGVTIGVGGASALVGGLIAERVSRRFGVGRTLIGALILGSATQLLMPLARGSLATPMMVLAQAGDIGLAIYFINELSLRQAITPDHLLGRANASVQFLTGAALPVGALVGGLIADMAGLRAAMWVGTVGIILGSAWVLLSPVRGVRELPAAAG